MWPLQTERLYFAHKQQYYVGFRKIILHFHLVCTRSYYRPGLIIWQIGSTEPLDISTCMSSSGKANTPSSLQWCICVPKIITTNASTSFAMFLDAYIVIIFRTFKHVLPRALLWKVFVVRNVGVNYLERGFVQCFKPRNLEFIMNVHHWSCSWNMVTNPMLTTYA